MSVYYLTLDDYLAIAVAVTGQGVQTLVTATDTTMADSALHAPPASFAGEEFYPDFVDSELNPADRTSTQLCLTKRHSGCSSREAVEFVT